MLKLEEQEAVNKENKRQAVLMEVYRIDKMIDRLYYTPNERDSMGLKPINKHYYRR